MRGGTTVPKVRLFPRFRRPSWKTLVGLTQAQRTLKRESGWYTLTKPFRTPYNVERGVKRRVGYYSFPMRLARWLLRKH
jgi:hypothetical protein